MHYGHLIRLVLVITYRCYGRVVNDNELGSGLEGNYDLFCASYVPLASVCNSIELNYLLLLSVSCARPHLCGVSTIYK